MGGTAGTPNGSPGSPGNGGNGGNSGGGGGGGLYGGGGGGNRVVGSGVISSGGGGGGGSSLVPAGGTGPTVTSAAASITISYTTPGKPVTTYLTAMPQRTRVGLPVVLSDLVCPIGGATTRPTGTVTFTDTTTGKTLGTGRLFLSLGNCAAAGTVTAFRTTGPHIITAVYSGDTVYQGNGANPETATVTVNP